MLIDRARVLTARIAELQELRNLANEAERLRTRTEQLENPLDALRSLSATWRLLRAQGIRVSLDKPSIALLRSQLDGVSATFHSNPRNILEANQEIHRRFFIPIQQYPTRLKESLLSAWKEYLEAKRPRVPDDILSILWNITDFRDQVTNIRILNRRVDELSAALPETQGIMEEAERVCSLLTEAWRNLQGDGIPPDVLQFIKKASDEGSSFEDLTRSVHDWLKSRDLLKRFKITTTR